MGLGRDMGSASSLLKSTNVSTRVIGSDGTGCALDSDQDGTVCRLLPIGNCLLS